MMTGDGSTTPQKQSAVPLPLTWCCCCCCPTAAGCQHAQTSCSLFTGEPQNTTPALPVCEFWGKQVDKVGVFGSVRGLMQPQPLELCCFGSMDVFAASDSDC